MCRGVYSCKIYSDIELKHWDAIGGETPNNPNDVTPNDNYYDKMLFQNDPDYPNYHLCLSPVEMNFYKTSANKLANDNRPVDKVITAIGLNGNVILCLGCPNFHQMDVAYAKVSSIPCGQLPD